jgi:hypothetical protein
MVVRLTSAITGPQRRQMRTALLVLNSLPQARHRRGPFGRRSCSTMTASGGRRATTDDPLLAVDAEGAAKHVEPVVEGAAG